MTIATFLLQIVLAMLYWHCSNRADGVCCGSSITGSCWLCADCIARSPCWHTPEKGSGFITGSCMQLQGCKLGICNGDHLYLWTEYFFVAKFQIIVVIEAYSVDKWKPFDCFNTSSWSLLCLCRSPPRCHALHARCHGLCFPKALLLTWRQLPFPGTTANLARNAFTSTDLLALWYHPGSAAGTAAIEQVRLFNNSL